MSFEDIKGEKKEEKEEKVVRIEPLAVDIAIDLITCAPEETLCKVAELMINHGVDTILVAEGNKPVGIVTSDAMFALISEGNNPCEVMAKDVMSPPVASVFSSDKVQDVASHFEKNKIHRLGVVDDDGALIGIISKKQYEQFRKCILAIKKRENE